MLEGVSYTQRNSGGGIAPAAIGALIEAGYWSVNAFRREARDEMAVAKHR
jgi:hypothetical protein